MTKGLHFLSIEPNFLLITSFRLVSTKASSGVMENVSLERCIILILEKKTFSKIKMIHLSRLTFSITPDEALVETRQKLVIKRKFGSMTFGHLEKSFNLLFSV